MILQPREFHRCHAKPQAAIEADERHCIALENDMEPLMCANEILIGRPVASTFALLSS
jgi:hypothetical protein